MNPNVKPWVINLSRLKDFWEPQIIVQDKNGLPVTFIDTEITISPEDGPPIKWNPANGRLTMPSAGVFVVNVLRSEIATYSFEKAPFRWSVTYTNGKVDGVWMESLVRVSD